MKKTIVIAVASIALTALVMMPSTGCKKDKCYECVKNAGQIDESHWDMCDEDSHDNAVASGFVCTEKP